MNYVFMRRAKLHAQEAALLLKILTKECIRLMRLLILSAQFPGEGLGKTRLGHWPRRPISGGF